MASDDLNFTNRMFTTNTVPLRYLVIPKCGCTFIKNLLWRLEHGDNYANQLRVHDSDEDFLRAGQLGLTSDDIRREVHAFTVVRNPVDRFYSLYTDKVVGKGYLKYVPLRATLAEKYGLNTNAVTADEHSANCDILIDWLTRNLEDEVDLPKEAHWTPQTYRWNLMRRMDLKLLLLSDLNTQLTALAGDIIPILPNLLQELESNKSKKPVSKGDVITRELRKKINKAYGSDRKLFQKTRDAWSKLDVEATKNAQVPRFSAIFGDG